MRRFVDPAVLVFIAALIVSLGVHLPIYEVLGVLRDRFRDVDALARHEDEGASGEDVEMAIEYDPEPPPTDAPVAEPSRASARTPRSASVRPPPPPEPEPPPPVVAPPPPEPPRPQVQQAEPEHPITQRSRDPNVEPPPDTRFAAEENSRVDEETVARERSMTQDDPEPSPAPSDSPSTDEPEDPGEEEETEVAQTEDREGADRNPMAGREAPSRDEPPAATSEAPSGDDGEDDGPREASRDVRPPSGPTPREGGGASEAFETITIHDGSGSFVIRRPRASGSGRGDSGGVAVTGPGGRRRSGEEDLGVGRPRSGRRGPPNLRVGYAQLEDIVGRQALEDERQTYLERRRSRRRGTDHAESWRRFRAAIENFVPNVRTGNQTALNARASPFAAYTAEVHRRLHEPFHDFLAGVGSSGPLSDPNLETKLEIVLNRDGTIFQVGVVHASGQILFDHGAWAAVYAGQPYPTAPDAILSGDGRVYLRWTFKSIEPFCHVIHAERYILDNAPASGAGGDTPSHGEDEPAPGLPSFPTSDEPRLRAARPR